MEGWIKLHRKLLDWEWYSDTNAKVLFLHCLLKANIKDTTWKGMEIKRGQFFTSNLSLSNELGLSIKEIRNSLKKLEKTGELTFFGASNGTMVTVCNYDNYQHLEQSTGKRWASDGQARGKRRATDREEEERKEEKIRLLLAQKCADFKKSLEPFLAKYGRDMLNEFYLYWTEPTKGNTKLKFELQKTWDVERRLLRWANNDFNKQTQPSSQPKNPKIVTQTGYNGFKFD